MKSRNKFATCRGVDEHEYYDEWTGELTQITNKPKQGAGSYILSSDDIAKKLMLGELSFTKYSVVDTSEGP